MAIGIIAQIGIGIVSSIIQSVASSAMSKGSDVSESAIQDTPSSKVSISDAAASLKKNAGAAKAAGNKSSVDQLFANLPDSVKKAWEKTREELGLNAGNESYYMNQMAMMALAAQSGLTPGGGVNNPSDFFGTSAGSAIDAVDTIIDRLNVTIPGYDSNSRDRQAALEMYNTFRQHLANAASGAVQV